MHTLHCLAFSVLVRTFHIPRAPCHQDMTLACFMVHRVYARWMQSKPRVLRPDDLAHCPSKLKVASTLSTFTPFAHVALSPCLCHIVPRFLTSIVFVSTQTSLPCLTFIPQQTHICNLRLAVCISDLLDWCVFAVVRYRYVPYTHARPYAGR